MNDVTKDLLEALQWAVENPDDNAYWLERARAAIARAEAALAASQPDASQAMARDDVIRMAREAGIPIERAQFPQGDDMVGSHGLSLLELLVEQARAEEREACAKVCDDLEREGFHYETYDGWEEVPAEACHCAAAIRARGEP